MREETGMMGSLVVFSLSWMILDYWKWLFPSACLYRFLRSYREKFIGRWIAGLWVLLPGWIKRFILELWELGLRSILVQKVHPFLYSHLVTLFLQRDDRFLCLLAFTGGGLLFHCLKFWKLFLLNLNFS